MSATVIIGSGRGAASSNVTAGPAFVAFGSSQIFPSATEAFTQVPVYTNGVVKNLRVAVANIGASTTHTIRLRVNGANGNSVVTVNGTGGFIDTTNTDRVVSGNLLDYSVTRTAGAGTLTLGVISCDFDNEEGYNIVGSTGNTSLNANNNQVIGIGDTTVTNINHRAFVFSNNVLKNLSVYASSNTLNSGITYISTIIDTTTNLSLLPLTVQIPASSTGLFTDTTGMYQLPAPNRWFFQAWRSGSTTGAITPSFIMVQELAEDSKVAYHCGRALPAITTNSTIVPIVGSMINGATPSGSYQVRVPQNCVLYPQDITIGISANTNATTTIFNFQVNGVNSTISASIPSASTANATGSGSPVFLKAGDLVNYFINDNGAAGTLQSRMISTAFTIDKFDANSDFF